MSNANVNKKSIQFFLPVDDCFFKRLLTILLVLYVEKALFHLSLCETLRHTMCDLAVKKEYSPKAGEAHTFFL
jgi:hypothetical protein